LNFIQITRQIFTAQLHTVLPHNIDRNVTTGNCDVISLYVYACSWRENTTNTLQRLSVTGRTTSLTWSIPCEAQHTWYT